MQVAAREDAPDRAGRVKHDQNVLLAFAVLTALASFVVNLFGAQRLLRAAKNTTRRISERVARRSAAGGVTPGAGAARGNRVVPSGQRARKPTTRAPGLGVAWHMDAETAPQEEPEQ